MKTVNGKKRQIRKERFFKRMVIDNSWEAVYGYGQRTKMPGSNGSVTTENDVLSQKTLTPCGDIAAQMQLVTIKNCYGCAERHANRLDKIAQ